MDWEPHDRHWIRLRGPWEVSRLSAEGETAPTRRVTLPADWMSIVSEGPGAVSCVRRFQTPTNLEPDERVCVTVTNTVGVVECRLNGVPVHALQVPLGDVSCWPAAACHSFDVTEHLKPMNQLVLIVTVPETAPEASGLYEPVFLEIITPDNDA